MYHDASGSQERRTFFWEEYKTVGVQYSVHLTKKTTQCKHIALSYKFSDLLSERLNSVDMNVPVFLWSRNKNPEPPIIVSRGEKQVTIDFVLKYVKAPVGCQVSGRPRSEKDQHKV